MPSDLVSIPAACRDYLDISAHTGYTLAARGDFPGDAAIKIGNQWRVSTVRLMRYLHGVERGRAKQAAS